MTRREKAIATAYTGVSFLPGKDIGALYEYAEAVLGRPVLDIFFADEQFTEELKEKAKPDFVKMCEADAPEVET